MENPNTLKQTLVGLREVLHKDDKVYQKLF